jgi:glycosyltransferase involved in cell wall biosynthesis
MKVSIITPTYNSAQYIEECILSVKNQNYKEIEHIVTDGKSTDGTVNILKRYENTYAIKYKTEKDAGIADGMNKGFRMASGDIFAWLDADNYYNENVIGGVVETFQNNPDVDIVYGNIDFVDTAHKKIGTHKPPSDITFKKALVRTTGAIPLQPAVFFKKEIYLKTGGFDTKYKVAGDYEFWLNVLKENPRLLYIDKTFGSYTIVTDASSQSFKGIINGFKEVRDTAKKYHQPFYGKILLYIKYSRGFLGKLIK